MSETKSVEEALAEAFNKADSLAAPLDERLKLYLMESRKLLLDLGDRQGWPRQSPLRRPDFRLRMTIEDILGALARAD